MIPVDIKGHYSPDRRYPSAMVNITNRCNLSCRHCFVYRDGNPNEPPPTAADELPDGEILETLAALRDRHGISRMLWMGGEPMLRPALLSRGVGIFEHNTITTNGTVPLLDLGPKVLYVVSLDGPKELNDSLRGKGVFDRVLARLARLPNDFSSPIQVQCVVTRSNQDSIAELVDSLIATRVEWMTFSFYVPRAGDNGGDAWTGNEERGVAVREVMRLKRLYPAFIRNSRRSLELMLSPHAKTVTDSCPAQRFVLPLYLEGERFVTPFCCYGNDVDCDRCGAWVVFDIAARLEDNSAPAETLAPN